MAERDQNEGSGQQPPIGQQDEDQKVQQGQQPQGQQQGQQPLGQQGEFGTQEPGLGRPDQESGQTGGQSSTGQESESGSGDTETLSEGSQPDLGGSQPDQSSGGFVGSKDEDSGEYLQNEGNPQAGFAEQGRGASNPGGIEGDTERSENRESDIEGSSDNS